MLAKLANVVTGIRRSVDELALAMLADKLALETSWKLAHKIAPGGQPF